ncbi:MAG: DinB family protein [Chloroflexi bacterium]|nr:MAG: DinB family protein [Chloroflexota bacterium]
MTQIDPTEAIRMADVLFEHTLASFPQALLHTQPRPGEWSAYEVLSHIEIVERERYLPQLAAAVRGETLSMTPVPGVLPASPPPFDELLANYRATRAEEIAFLEGLPRDQWATTIFNHWTYGEIDIHWLARRMQQHTLDGTQQSMMALGLLTMGAYGRDATPPTSLDR